MEMLHCFQHCHYIGKTALVIVLLSLSLSLMRVYRKVYSTWQVLTSGQSVETYSGTQRNPNWQHQAEMVKHTCLVHRSAQIFASSSLRGHFYQPWVVIPNSLNTSLKCDKSFQEVNVSTFWEWTTNWDCTAYVVTYKANQWNGKCDNDNCSVKEREKLKYNIFYF